MGTVRFVVETDADNAQQTFNRLVEAQKRAEGGMERLGRTGRRAGQQTKGAFDDVAASIPKVLTGMVSLGGAMSLFNQWIAHLKQIRDLQVQIGEGGLEMQRGTIPLAEQMGMSSRGGLMEATRQAFATAQAGSIPIADAGRIRQAALSRIQGTTEAGKVAIGNIVSKAIGKTGGTAEQGEALVQLLSNIGVKDAAGATRAIAQIQAGLLGSDELSVGTFAESITKGGVGMVSLGTKLEDIIAFGAQARKVSATKDESAELMRQIFQNLGDKEAQKIIGKQMGIRPDDVMALPPTEQIMAMQQAIVGARARGGDPAVAKLIAPLDARMRTQMLRFFSGPAMETAAHVRGVVAAARPETVEQEWQQFAKTDVAVARRMENERQMRRAEQQHARFRQTELRKEATARLEEARAAGQIGFAEEKLFTDEGLLEDYAAVVQAEALGLIPQGTGRHGGPGALSSAEIVVRRAKQRMGMPQDTAVLDRGDLSPEQLRGLQAYQLEQARVAGFRHEQEFFQQQAALTGQMAGRAGRAGRAAATQPAGSVTNIFGDVYERAEPGVARRHPNAPQVQY